jgi:hypothetical protein
MSTGATSGHGRPDPVGSEVIGERRALINTACRMLGARAGMPALRAAGVRVKLDGGWRPSSQK